MISLVKKQEIKGDEAVRVIRNTVTEVLFDLLQQEALGKLTFECDRQNALNTSLTLLNPQHAIAYSKQAWEQWCKAGLEKLSPNAAVLLRQPQQLQQHTSAPVYQTLIKIVDGERTLRDLAILMKQDLLLVTRLLSPYIRQGILELIKIGDLPLICHFRESKIWKLLGIGILVKSLQIKSFVRKLGLKAIQFRGFQALVRFFLAQSDKSGLQQFLIEYNTVKE